MLQWNVIGPEGGGDGTTGGAPLPPELPEPLVQAQRQNKKEKSVAYFEMIEYMSKGYVGGIGLARALISVINLRAHSEISLDVVFARSSIHRPVFARNETA